MKSKHTQGEWHIRDLEVIGEYGSNKSICEITGHFMDADEAMANLLLISKSPKLLKAAQDCQIIADRCNNAMLSETVQNILQNINDTLTEAIKEATNQNL